MSAARQAIAMRKNLSDSRCRAHCTWAWSSLGAERTGEPIIERATLRPFILISALLVFASPAVAQNWQEYSYPDYSFRVTFPADPQIEATTYRVTDDRKVEALVYFVRRDNAEFKVTVADLADAGLEPSQSTMRSRRCPKAAR
jgi:hypothetical protein